MSRSVSVPSGAVVVAYSYCGENEDDYGDDDQVVEDFRQSVLLCYKSTWQVDKWLGREDLAIAANDYAYFGISEYCGLIAYWVVLRDECEAIGRATAWVNRIAPKFKERFATLQRVGVFSNGEAVYERR